MSIRRVTADSTVTVLPEPTGAATPIEYAGRLRALMASRRQTVDKVVRTSKDAGTPVSRATVHNLLSAATLPRQESLLGFLRGCGVPPQEQIRWLITFQQVYPDGHGRIRRAA